MKNAILRILDEGHEIALANDQRTAILFDLAL